MSDNKKEAKIASLKQLKKELHDLGPIPNNVKYVNFKDYGFIYESEGPVPVPLDDSIFDYAIRFFNILEQFYEKSEVFKLNLFQKGIVVVGNLINDIAPNNDLDIIEYQDYGQYFPNVSKESKLINKLRGLTCFIKKRVNKQDAIRFPSVVILESARCAIIVGKGKSITKDTVFITPHDENSFTTTPMSAWEEDHNVNYGKNEDSHRVCVDWDRYKMWSGLSDFIQNRVKDVNSVIDELLQELLQEQTNVKSTNKEQIMLQEFLKDRSK